MKKAFSFNTSEFLLHKNVLFFFLPSVFVPISICFVFSSKLMSATFFEKVKILDLRKHMKSWILVKTRSFCLTRTPRKVTSTAFKVPPWPPFLLLSMKKAFSFNTYEFFLHKNVLVFFLHSVFVPLSIFLPFFFKIDVSDIFEKVKILDLIKHMKSWILV